MANLTTTQEQDTGSNQALTANSWSGTSTTATAPTPSQDAALVNTASPQNTPPGDTQPTDTAPSQAQGNTQQGGPSTNTNTTSGTQQPLPSTTPTDTSNNDANQPATTSSQAASGGNATPPTTTKEATQPAENNMVGGTVQNTPSDETTTGGAVLMITWELIAALVIVTLCYYLYSRWLEWYEKYKKGYPQPVPVPCKTCGGTGVVKEKVSKSAPCGHCKETWRDICHHCGGSGKNGLGLPMPQTEEEVASLINCDYCGDKGFSDPPVACCMCKGEKKIYYQETIEVPCPDCKGKKK